MTTSIEVTGRRTAGVPPAQPCRFSVVVTSYNYKAHVVAAIESVLSQSVAPWEIIVVDDGSTDGSSDVLVEFSKVHPNVRVILSEKNRGQLGAFVLGVECCSGEIICFLDADDTWEPDYLETLNARYRQFSKVDCVLANVKYVGQRSGTWGGDADRDWGLTVLWAYAGYASGTGWVGVPTSGISMRAELCRQVLDLPASYFRDWRVRADDCLVFGVSLLGGQKLYMAEPKVNYRVHDANHWLGKPQDEAAILRRDVAIHRLIRHYLGEPGTVLLPPMAPLLEFKTKPTPTFGEFVFYVRLALRTRQGLIMRGRQAFSMLRHYLRAHRAR